MFFLYFSSFYAEQSDPCGFEDGMCGWETPTYYQIPLIDGDLSTTSGNLSVFINDTEIPNRKFAVSGADGPQGKLKPNNRNL